VARQFPEIVAYGSAFRFALEAEGAAADIAAAAAARAPDGRWRSTLEELARSHRDHVDRLTAIRREVNEMILEPIDALDSDAYLGTLDQDPAATWPAVVTQLIAAERDVARYHDDFVTNCDDVLAASSRAFRKAAKQDRAAADELTELLAA
jgi:rubrerythrin